MLSQEEIDTQLNLLATNRGNLAHYLLQQAKLGEAYAPPAVANGIREARRNIRRIKGILRDNNVPVSDHPDDGDNAYETPRSSPPAMSSPPVTSSPSVDRVKLRQTLTDYFSLDDLRDVCFDLGIDYESLEGLNKPSKVRELIIFAERHSMLDRLVEHARQLRPDVNW